MKRNGTSRSSARELQRGPAATASVWIVIPALNEARTIGRVVSELRGLGYSHVCVVNDGSRDATGSIARDAGAYVLNHVTNLGQGAALQTGISFAIKRGAEYICTFDGDGQHSPRSVEALLNALQRSGADVALGSRFLENSYAVPTARRMLLKGALLFTHLHAGLSVTDTHNGLRAFTRHAAQSVRIEQPQMAHASEILQKIGAANLDFVEVPVDVDYSPYSRKKGQSGFDSVKIVLDLFYRAIALRP
jgi:polyprenyl-phospho-N-acetylgalactosaminyl synthase